MRRDFHMGWLTLAGALVGIGGVGTCPLSVQAQVAEEAPSLQIGPERDKALRYHKALQRRPAPGFLFDRFCDAWLEDGTYAELETFLNEQATASGNLNDQLLLAYLYARQGDDVKSLEQFRGALAADPGSASAWYEKAVTEARTLDLETALADLDRADAAAPDDEQAILIGKLRASLLVRNRQNDQAVSAWNTLIASRPDDEGLLEDIIEQMIAEGLYDEALEKSDALIAVTRDPYQQVVRRMRKGDILQRAGRQAEALEVYAQTLLKIGRDTWLEREMIAQIDMLFRREDNLTGLKEQLDKLLAAEPDRIALHRAAARLQQQLGDSEAAIEAFQKIIELTPGDRSNREAFVALLAESGRLEQAIAQLQGLAEQYPDDAELAMRLAGLHHLAEDSEQTVAAVNAFVEKSARSEVAFLRAARVLQSYDLPAEARGMYEAGVAAFPDSITCREAFAGWLHEHDEKTKALEIWRSVASGGDRSERIRVARILASHNEHQAAFDLLDARRDEFADDSVYLGQLIDEAIVLDKFSEAAPLVLQRVRLSDNAIDLDTSILQAMRVYGQLDDRQAMLGEVRHAAESSIPAACLLAEILESRGERSEADALLESRTASIAKDDSPDEARLVERQMVLNQQIRLASARQDWPQAAVAAKAMIELPRGRNSVNVRRLVDLYLRNQQLDEALHWVGEWKQVSPGSLLPWINESKILARVGREDDSLRALRAAARKFPEDADLAAMLAEKFALNGLPKEAERIYWKQFESSEPLADRLRWVEQLARLSDMNGTTEQLIETMKERCESNPESIEPLLALAQVHRVADNFEERRQALMEATRKQPDNLNLMLEIARMEEAEGEWEQALATLESAQSLDRGDQVKQQIARICMGYGDLDRGLRILAEMAGGENANPRDVEAIADALVRADQWERARDYLAPHVTRLPEDYRLKYLMATIDEFLGDEDGAWRSFLSLLSADGLLPGVVASQNTSPMLAQLDMVRRGMPPGVATFYESNVMESLAYSYREGGRYYSSAFGVSQGTGVIRLPADGEECRKLALCHLLKIAAEASHDDQKALVEAMTSRGIGEAELMVALTETGSDISQIEADLNDEFPDNPTLLSISVMNSMNNPADEELLLKAYEKFKDSYPDMAFVAAIQLAMRNPDHTDLAKTVMENVRAQESPSDIVLASLFQMQMRDPFEASADEPSEINGLVNDFLIEIYPKLRTSQAMMTGMGDYVFQAIVSTMAVDPDPTRLIKFLESELEGYRASGSSPYQSGGYGGFYPGYGGGYGLITLPAFPPDELDGLPSTFAELEDVLAGDSLASSPYAITRSRRYMSDRTEPDPSRTLRYRDAVNGVSDPLLKAYLQAHMGIAMELQQALSDDGAAETDAFADLRETLTASAAVGKPDLDMMLIEAGLAAHTRNWEEATRILEQSRSLPMTRERRATIDGALVALAISDDVVDDAPSGLEQIQQAARSAALRLRRGPLDADQRQRLMGILERLGLTEEAEQMEQRMAASPTPYSGSFSSSPSISVGRASPQRVLELIDDGKVDDATRLLEQQFAALSREILNASYGYRNNSYEMREFVEMVRSLNMNEALLASLDPGDSGAARKLAPFALAHEFIGEKVKAAEAYRAAIEADPKNSVYRLRLIAVEFQDNSDCIGEQLAALSRRDVPEFVSALLEQVAESECSVEQLMASLEQLIVFAEQQPDGEIENLEWMGDVIRIVAAPRSLVTEESELLYPVRVSQTSELPSLYSPVAPDDGAKSASESVESANGDEEEGLSEETLARIKTVNALRRDLHERACQIGMQCATGSTLAFTSWLSARVAAGEEPGTEAVDKARQTLLISSNSGNGSRPTVTNVYSYSSQAFEYDRYVTSRVEAVTPERYLARHYAGQSPPDHAAVGQLVEALKDNRNRAAADGLENLFRFYSVADADYLTACRQYMEWGEVRQNREAFNPQLIVDIWVERELTCDLEPIIMEVVDGIQPRRGGLELELSAIAKFCSQVAATRPDAEVRSLVATIRRKMAGSDEELQSRIERRERNGERVRDAALGLYSGFLISLTNEVETVVLGLEEAEKFGILVGSMDSSARRTILQFLKSETDAEKVLDWLRKARFVGTVDQFRPRIGDWSLAELFDYAGSPGEWASAEDLEALLKQQPRPAIGDRYFEMRLTRQWDNEGLLNELAAEIPALEKMDPARQAALHDLLLRKSSYDVPLDKDSLDGDARKVAELLQAAKLATSGDVLARVLEAKSLDELEVESYDVDEWILSDLLPFAASDPERSADAIAHLFDLTSSSNSGMSRSYYSSGRSLSMRETLLMRIIDHSSDLTNLPLVLDLVGHPRYGFVAPNEEILDMQGAFANGMTEFFEAMGASAADFDAEHFEAFNDRLAKALNGRDPVSLVRAMAIASRQFSIPQRDVMRTVAIAASEQDGAAPLYRAWAYALELDFSQVSSDETADDGDAMATAVRFEQLTPLQQQMLDVVADDTRTLSERFAVAQAMIEGDRKLPLTAIPTCLATVTEAMDDAEFPLELAVDLLPGLLDIGSDEAFVELVGGFGLELERRLLARSSEFELDKKSFRLAVRFFDRLDKDTTITQIVRGASGEVFDRGTVAVLLRLGLISQARQMVAESFKEDPSLTESFDVDPDEATSDDCHDELMASGVAALIELLPTEGEKYLAELWFAAMPDLAFGRTAGAEASTDSEAKAASISTLADRIQPLAQRFGETEFKSEIQREQAMILLSQNPDSASVVAEVLAERASRLRTLDLWGDIVGDDRQEHNIRLLATRLIQCVQQGDRESVATVGTLFGSEDRESYEVEYVSDELKGHVAEYLRSAIPSMSEASLVRMLPALRDLIDALESGSYSDRAIESSCLLAHVIAGKAQDYVQWKEGREEGRDDEFWGNVDTLWPPVSHYLKSTAASDDAKRIEMVFTMWKLATEAGFGVGSGHFQEGVKESCESCRTAIMGLDAIKEAGLMSAEELVANGAALAQINPVDGEIWRQVAWEHVALEQFEAAETAFQRALQVTPDELEQARENRKVEYAWILRENGKADEAIQQLENVDASMMLGDNTARLKQLQSSLE